MARVTVEDCVTIVPNRFDLVMLAAQRARDISAGLPLTIDRDNDKNPVVALREIADKTVKPDELREAVVQGLQKLVDIDEPEEDEGMEMVVPEEGFAALAPEAPVALSGAAAAIDAEDDLSIEDLAAAEAEASEAAEEAEKE